MKLGDIIKKYRHDNKLSLRDFAKTCGTSHSYIAMLEDGKNSKTGEPIVPAIVTLKKIATALNMSLNDLIFAADDMPVALSTPSPEISENEAILLELFRQVPAEHQEMVLGMIRVAIGNQVPPRSQ